MKPIIILFLSLLLSLSIDGQSAFTDIAKSAGVWELGANYGVSFADFDNDGWEDIYVTRRIGPNRLYRNLGDETFEEVAAEVGLAYEGDTRMAIWGDLNNDGYVDVFLGNNKGEQDLIYLNDGKGQFVNISDAAGMEKVGDVMAVMFGDLDNDSFLDIYVARWNNHNTLYMNKGTFEVNEELTGVTFKNETQLRGPTDTRVAMGAMLFDYDNDRDLDIYLVHDGRQANYLYQNDGNGFFKDVAMPTGADYKGFGMGVDFGDVNNDGWLDIYITNLHPNALLINNQDGTFREVTDEMGVGDDGMGWGTAFFDYDNDGWQDIYFGNTNPTKPNLLYKNMEGATFQTMADPLLSSLGNSFGVACSDFNQDGKVDLFVSNSNDDIGNHFFKNESETDNNWIAIQPIGVESNHSAIGTRVTLEVGDNIYIDEVASGSSYASQNSLILHFGLGAATLIDKLTLDFPSGITDVYENIAVTQLMTLMEGNAISTSTNDFTEFQHQIKFSPNPASSQLTLEIDALEKSDLEIGLMTVQGQQIGNLEHRQVNQGVNTINLNLDDFSNGLYFLKISDFKNSNLHKVIIAK